MGWAPIVRIGVKYTLIHCLKAENAGYFFLNLCRKCWLLLSKIQEQFCSQIDCMMFNAFFNIILSYITAVSAPMHTSLEFFLPVLCTVFFPSH